MVGLYKKFILCLCIALLWVHDAHSFKLKKGLGGKKNPGAAIIKFLTVFPGLFESFGSALVKTKAAIQTARMSLQLPVPQPELLLKSYMLIGMEIYKLHVQSINFRKMPPVLMFKTFAFQCGSPVLTAGMGIPGVGQVVVGLCSRLSSLEVKFDVLITRIENTISEGMQVRESIQNRLLQMPNGQELIAKVPTIVLPPLPPELIEPPKGIPGLTIPKLPSVPNPQMIMQNAQGQIMEAAEDQMQGAMSSEAGESDESGEGEEADAEKANIMKMSGLGSLQNNAQNKIGVSKGLKASQSEDESDDSDSGGDDGE